MNKLNKLKYKKIKKKKKNNHANKNKIKIKLKRKHLMTIQFLKKIKLMKYFIKKYSPYHYIILNYNNKISKIFFQFNLIKKYYKIYYRNN